MSSRDVDKPTLTSAWCDRMADTLARSGDEISDRYAAALRIASRVLDAEERLRAIITRARWNTRPLDQRDAEVEELRGKLADEHGVTQYSIKKANEEEARAQAAEQRLKAVTAALAGVEPYLDAIVCYASTMDEHEPNRVAFEVRQALAASPQDPSQDPNHDKEQNR